MVPCAPLSHGSDYSILASVPSMGDPYASPRGRAPGSPRHQVGDVRECIGDWRAARSEIEAKLEVHSKTAAVANTPRNSLVQRLPTGYAIRG
jgi:hypothetical protein